MTNNQAWQEHATTQCIGPEPLTKWQLAKATTIPALS